MSDTKNILPVRFSKMDEVIQRVLILSMLLTLMVFPPIAGILLIILGGWQVFSGAVGMYYGNKWKRTYFGLVVIYFFLLYLTVNLCIENNWMLDSPLMIVLSGVCCVFPMISALVYYTRTREELPKEADMVTERSKDMDDILDANIFV